MSTPALKAYTVTVEVIYEPRKQGAKPKPSQRRKYTVLLLATSSELAQHAAIEHVEAHAPHPDHMRPIAIEWTQSGPAALPMILKQ